MKLNFVFLFFPDGLISYSMPQGERRGVEIDLSDKTYDGIKDDNYLQEGLGQLTDGVVGDDSFKQNLSGMGRGKTLRYTFDCAIYFV